MKQRPELASHFQPIADEGEFENNECSTDDIVAAVDNIDTHIDEDEKHDSNNQVEDDEEEIDVVSLDEDMGEIPNIPDGQSEEVKTDDADDTDKTNDKTEAEIEDSLNEALKVMHPTGKPSNSFNVMIMTAIKESPAKKLTLNEIYDFITEKYPYYNEENKKSWQNSVRHNLSMNKCFVRVARNSIHSGKGSFWTLTAYANQAFIEDGRLWMGRSSSSSPYNDRNSHSVFRCSGFNSQVRYGVSQARYNPYFYSNIERVPQNLGQYSYSAQSSTQVTQAMNYPNQGSGSNSMAWYTSTSEFPGSSGAVGGHHSLPRTQSVTNCHSGYTNVWVPPPGFNDLLALTRQLAPSPPAAAMSTRGGQSGGTCVDNSPPISSYTDSFNY